MQQKIVTIVGGTGFVGRYVVQLLARTGYTLRIITRNPDTALHLKTAGDIGQIVLMHGNLAKPETLTGKLAHSFAVINLVGILFESGEQRFTQLHAKGAEKLAQMAKAEHVTRFIHSSALGIEQAAGSHYARSKLLGEKAVLAAFPEASILRPSIIFGPEDHFFNRFAAMASFLPLLPLIGGGQTRFQPVYVGNVASAILACLERHETQGQTYELGGPRIYTLRKLLEYILRITMRRRMLLPMPFGLAAGIGRIGECLPRPPLTRDQVLLLKHDSIVSAGAKNLVDLGITPSAVETIVPEYLARFHKKTAA